jgi:beta-lactamase regulating signal transducer with metallopeptidase domain
MENYLLKSSIALVILYVLYRIVLRYEFNHQLNRIIGLACIIFSIGFPFVHINTSSQLVQLPQTVYSVTADLQENLSSEVSNDSIDIFLWVYTIGAGLLVIRLLVGVITLVGFYFNSTKRNEWGFTVVTLDRKMSPFSFFNILFIGSNVSSDDPEIDGVIAHEQAHRDQYHSIDAILLEVSTIIFWFNPAIWFFRSDIKAQHEYYADKRVITTGINPITYQQMLFKALTGVSIELANHLSNKTSLTKRFNMMTKTSSKSSSGFLRASLFVVLMAAMLFFGAFSRSNVIDLVDKVAAYPGGEPALAKSISQKVTYPQIARKENRSGLVQVSFTVNEKGEVENVAAEAGLSGQMLNEIVVVGYYKPTVPAQGVDDVLKAEGVRVVKLLGKFNPAEKDGKPVSSVLILPIKFKLE